MARNDIAIDILVFPQEGLLATCLTKTTNGLDTRMLSVHIRTGSRAEFVWWYGGAAVWVVAFRMLALLVLGFTAVVDVHAYATERSLNMIFRIAERTATVLVDLTY